MKFFDSHAHYYDERFSEELSESVDSLVDTLLSENTSYIVNIGTAPDTSRAAIRQARCHENMYAAAGIHPSDTRFITDMAAALAEIRALLLDKENKCVAIGEIGLDYHYPDTDKEKQAEYFEAQMLLAEELDFPVIIHDREAHGDIMEVIRRHPSVRGVLHSFSGSPEMAEELISLGYIISFSGTLTFTNARRPREVAARVPRECVMIETDCPYLTPHPHRGKLNHSGYLEYTAAALAEIWGVTVEECAKITEENARRFFSL